MTSCNPPPFYGAVPLSASTSTPHVVLLGDSIFDNGPYVPTERDTTSSHLRRILPDGWRVKLLAVDGHLTRDVERQLPDLPRDASHLLVSAGGNDALQVAARWGLLENQRFGAVARQLATYQKHFRREYRAMLQAVLVHNLATAVCTVYTAVPGLPEEQVAALSYYNDVIVEEAARARVAVVDLRLVCEAEEDYSPRSPIEPSTEGGRKIAQALAGLVTAWPTGKGLGSLP
jgi:hypothetical protein